MGSGQFINDNFLLQNEFSEALYHDYAAKQPIIDYHNHLVPQDIANNRTFENISKVWLAGDHYKWRAMRALGVDERLITGDASDEEKFVAWAKSVPSTLRNPLYHWTHLELKRYFGIDQLLNENNAKELYHHINDQLQQPSHHCRRLLTQMNVEALCTTEDPTDDLKHHKALRSSDFKLTVTTAFRPDKAIVIEDDGFNAYLDALEKVSDLSITSYQDLKDVLRKRIEYFHENGCRLCDHGLNHISFESFTDADVASIFEKRRQGQSIDKKDAEKFKTAILIYLGETYHEFGWVQQFHLGALRNNNRRMLGNLGPDTGWDSIGDYPQAATMSAFFNALDSKDKLAKTIIYNLNPADNEIFATMIGNFNDGSVKGKMQYGSSWWFLDQKDGIIKQLNALSNMGLISCFIGMLTDSRSFLSFPRHEYFRRVLCNLLGEEMKNGELPQDVEMLGKMVADISYGNAKNYFDF